LARKILLADDSVTAQNMGRKILADAGYEVITVNNGSAALKKITEAKPDLIVLDVYMPGYSGLEVCQRLKEVQETSRIPVLLTVGKLEPFKPEEAKRVRAEGYIVKPFEASELLSALAKLEDKIVPRAEASKPGRFARANAALDDSRFDKSVAIEEDSGWKNRISFPTKKKDKPAEAEADATEAAIHTPPPHKDLANVVEPYQPSEAQADSRVNLGALAPEGLPKDVTPEEIAALAAAAAQVKGKIAHATVAETPSPAAVPEGSHPEVTEAQPEAKSEAKSEAKPEAQSAAELPAQVHAKATATFASQKPEEIEAPAAASSETAAEVSVPAPSPADVGAAIAALEPAAAVSAHASPGNGSHAAAEKPAEQPATMAVAAGAESAHASSRWMAVPIALAAEEAATSLEQEMQKAYAAFAEAQNAHAQFVASIPEIHPEAAEAAIEQPLSAQSSPFETAAAGPVVSAPESPAQEVSQAMSAVASAATEAISAAVKELEAVAASYTDLHPHVPSQPEPAPVEAGAPSAYEAQQPIEAKVQQEPASHELATSKADASGMLAEQPKIEESRVEEPSVEGPKIEEQKIEEPKEQSRLDASEHEKRKEESKHEEAKLEELKSEEPLPVASAEASVSSTPEDAEPKAQPASAPGNTGKKDSDIAATTAAAWANWRRVRESGSPKAADELHQDVARAVAAGAETTPDGVAPANQDSGDIADIVDSVLADLRPKIVEEISRKMKKK
jgi:two-component system chemotaxis response regulator CheY